MPGNRVEAKLGCDFVSETGLGTEHGDMASVDRPSALTAVVTVLIVSI